MLESGKTPLSKVLISGGGRCNVMHDYRKGVKLITQVIFRSFYLSWVFLLLLLGLSKRESRASWALHEGLWAVRYFPLVRAKRLTTEDRR